MMESIFSPLWETIFFGEMSTQSLCPFKNYTFCCCVLRILYVFCTLNPYQVCDLEILPPSLWVFFSFYCWCVLKYKFLILMKSNLFSFAACLFGVFSRKQLPNPRLLRFMPMLSSKSPTVSALIFRTVINFS